MTQTTILVHEPQDNLGLRIAEIPAILRLEVPQSLTNAKLKLLVEGCVSQSEGTITGALDEIKESIDLSELPYELIDQVKHSDVWVHDLGDIQVRSVSTNENKKQVTLMGLNSEKEAILFSESLFVANAEELAEKLVYYRDNECDRTVVVLPCGSVFNKAINTMNNFGLQALAERILRNID